LSNTAGPGNTTVALQMQATGVVPANNRHQPGNINLNGTQNGFQNFEVVPQIASRLPVKQMNKDQHVSVAQ
jgi:hypothetical protein